MSNLKTNTNGESQQYETQMEAHIPEKKTRKPGGGRKPLHEIVYEDVEDHIEATIVSNGTHVKFKIDKDDLERVKTRHWYLASGGHYVGSCVTIEGKSKVLYLHNFVMNKLDFPGKGPKESIDHINRNGLDNRKSNLRLVSQSIQNVNKKARGRTAELPEGITELPKHVWYIKPNGLHGDRFCIELKTEGVTWKTTSSKKVSIHEKLQQAKDKLNELYEEYPHLKPSV
jgi:hypothetical protein